MIRVGRYTAALLLLTVGVLLFLDLSMHTYFLSVMFKWWPMLLIVFGCEFLFAAMRSRNEPSRLRIDFGSLFFSALLAVVVVAATQTSLLAPLINQFGVAVSDESGSTFGKETVHIPLRDDTESIIITNENGDVTLQSGDVAAIEIRATVMVSGDDEHARRIADESTIAYEGERTLQITAQGKDYKVLGLKRKPRMNLDITVPRTSDADKELRAMNGSISVSNIIGSVKADTVNGKATVRHIDGSVELHSVNGSLTAEEITGDVKMDTINGKITGTRLRGSVSAHTTNGAISLQEVAKAVHADTTSGGIYVSSGTVGGDWKLQTTIGSVELKVPENGDYRVEGKTKLGSAKTNLPLAATKRAISGTIGRGTYQINVDASGSIAINKTQ